MSAIPLFWWRCLGLWAQLILKENNRFVRQLSEAIICNSCRTTSWFKEIKISNGVNRVNILHLSSELTSPNWTPPSHQTTRHGQLSSEPWSLQLIHASNSKHVSICIRNMFIAFWCIWHICLILISICIHMNIFVKCILENLLDWAYRSFRA